VAIKPPKPALPIDSGPSPSAGEPGPPTKWTFSFRFWSQPDFFGTPNRASWFVSLLERLRQLSQCETEELNDALHKDALRYHEIDWNAKNIPVKRKDFKMVARTYLDNEDDYPFVQVHISKGVGRIVGFWDENNIFNVVVLDALHNLQPSSYRDYRVVSTTELSCDYSALIKDLDNVRARPCVSAECELNIAVRKVSFGALQDHEVLLLPFMDGTIKEAQRLISEGIANSMSDIFERGIIAYLGDQHQKKLAG
jgi:hypothetical protein